MSKFKLFQTLIIILFLAFILAARFKIYPIYQFATQSNSVDVEKKAFIAVKKGASPFRLSEKLEDKNLISSAYQFHQLGRYMKKWKNIKIGEYAISSNMTPLEIFDVLIAGKSASRPVTLQEGLNIYQMAEKLEENDLVKADTFITLLKSKKFMISLGFTDPLPPSLEGYLYPNTYHFNRTMTEKQIAKTMVNQFKKVWTVDFQKRANQIGFTKNEAMTLASIIEKETGAAHERPTISSVFHNRLKRKMRLQTDPTIIYGMWSQYKGNIKREHMKVKNKYNTYMMRGLPIGPIANPGKAAIKAALYPIETEFLYFVSKNDGTHYFSETYKKHKAGVQKYQMNRAARKGKSWRDLKQ